MTTPVRTRKTVRKLAMTMKIAVIETTTRAWSRINGWIVRPFVRVVRTERYMSGSVSMLKPRNTE
eukprot:CAMPEP_0204916622 /NCGR_PEP_ID=MMETSP1397-20131031/14394_1 /ASSEMBLY_ACC=CAM_ASM_000891 /TAXON_ID=49980 /ORGANISM="Climacostomum Climacostomum virens, Strain Stock W-24" /LENGTH=64 /DNA_ID=CAMNT_0052089193 /DNA_START=109 /DNA_END=303 /DNA_ORIENTATION=+